MEEAPAPRPNPPRSQTMTSVSVTDRASSRCCALLLSLWQPQTIADATGSPGRLSSRPVVHIAHPDPKVPRATYLGCPTSLPMAPKPAHDLTKHMCQRAGPAGRVDGRPARLCGRSRPSCRHSRMEAVGGATRHGLPCRAAPPASSPRAVLMENASLAAFHVKAGSIERAGLHL